MHATVPLKSTLSTSSRRAHPLKISFSGGVYFVRYAKINEDKVEDRGQNNDIHVGDNVVLSGFIEGNNNRINFAGSKELSHVQINMTGDNNELYVGHAYALKGLGVVVGSHIPAHHVILKIGANFSIEPGGQFLLYTSGGSLTIGDHCMFSANVKIRCGESPHLLFERETGKFLDAQRGVSIGNHVWIGEDAYLTKSASLANECVVGARSVVTKVFSETNCVVAGNPSRVTRRGVQWIRNKYYLDNNSKYAVSHKEFYDLHENAQSTKPKLPDAYFELHHSKPHITAPDDESTTETSTQGLEIERLRHRVRALEESTSWKITSPFRFMKNLFRKS